MNEDEGIRRQLHEIEDFCGSLSQELASVKAERDEARASAQSNADGMHHLNQQRIKAESELAALRRPGVRVPVRWDVTPVEATMAYTAHISSLSVDAPLHPTPIYWLMNNYLAAHATIAVPPEMPPLDELVGIQLEHKNAIAGVAAIRDRIVAALAPRALPSREEVARALQAEYCKHYGIGKPDADLPKHYLMFADAVLALFAGCAPETFYPCNPPEGTEEILQAQKNVTAAMAGAFGMKMAAAPTEPTDAQVEALARVLCKGWAEGTKTTWVWDTISADLRDGFIAEARAAFACPGAPKPHRWDCIYCDYKGDSLAGLKDHSAGCTKHPLWREPADSDAWKTPVALKSAFDDSTAVVRLDPGTGDDLGMCVLIVSNTDGEYASCCLTPADAARLALWAASYANAHGCPVDVRTPLLLQPVTAAGMEMTVGECVKLLESTEADLQRAIRALNRSGFQDLGGQEWMPPLGSQPRLVWSGPTRAEAEAKWRELHNRDFTSLSNAKDYLDWLLPQLPESRTPDIGAPGPLVLVPNEPEPIATLETLEALAEIGYDVEPFVGENGPVSWENFSGKKRVIERTAAILRAAQAYVDVTPDEWAKKLSEFWTISVKTKEAFDSELLDFLNSRIRSRIVPQFECAECALYERQITAIRSVCDTRNAPSVYAARAALEGE